MASGTGVPDGGEKSCLTLVMEVPPSIQMKASNISFPVLLSEIYSPKARRAGKIKSSRKGLGTWGQKSGLAPERGTWGSHHRGKP